MAKEEKEARVSLIEFGALLAREVPRASAWHIAQDAARLVRLARSLHALYEAACNRELTPGEEKRMEALEAQAAKVAVPMYARAIEHQRDPRGAPLKLTFRSLPRDSEGTYVVPWLGA